MNFESIIFVLVGTTHSGNIGAAARAMKTMGFHQMRLVECCSHRTAEAISRASGANAVLEQAQVFDNLDDAIADCQYVYGTSARVRHLSVPLVSAEAAAQQIANEVGQGAAVRIQTDGESRRVALVFGRERSGLSNDELDRCTRLLNIPVNPSFSSLNLGSAVQVVAYEISKALNKDASENRTNQAETVGFDPDSEQLTDRSAPANSQTMTLFFEHMERALITIGFLDPDNPRLLMRRLRGYFERNRPDMTEMSILRGILSASENPRPKSSPKSDNDQ